MTGIRAWDLDFGPLCITLDVSIATQAVHGKSLTAHPQAARASSKMTQNVLNLYQKGV